MLGGTGATGRLLTRELLERGHQVRVIVRDPAKLPPDVLRSGSLSVTRAGVLDLSQAELVENCRGCHAVACCLGHNVTFRGIFGPPWRLVTDATRRVCEAIGSTRSQGATRFVLMNTAGNRNADRGEKGSVGERAALALLRALVPPHADNEQAADYLRVRIGQADEGVEWVAVRPDTLVDEEAVTEYEVHPSPTRSALFDPGRTSRINVAHFMADLITDDETWSRWRGQMPVIYDRSAGAR